MQMWYICYFVFEISVKYKLPKVSAGQVEMGCVHAETRCRYCPRVPPLPCCRVSAMYALFILKLAFRWGIVRMEIPPEKVWLPATANLNLTRVNISTSG